MRYKNSCFTSRCIVDYFYLGSVYRINHRYGINTSVYFGSIRQCVIISSKSLIDQAISKHQHYKAIHLLGEKLGNNRRFFGI